MCSFNDSRDLQSIDSATRIHLYVWDEIHLLTNAGFDFQQSVQYETAEIPCRPTHPNVTVALSLEGRGAVNIDNKYITFNPKVGTSQCVIIKILGGHARITLITTSRCCTPIWTVGTYSPFYDLQLAEARKCKDTFFRVNPPFEERKG